VTNGFKSILIDFFLSTCPVALDENPPSHVINF